MLYIQLRQSKVAEIINNLGEVGKAGKVEKPVFNGILFEVEEQVIKVTSTNGIEAVHMLLQIDGTDVQVRGTGKFVIMKTDFRVLGALKGNIAITVEGNSAKIKHGRRKIDFPLLDAEQYPNVLPTTAPLRTFVLPSSVLKYVVNTTSYALATTSTDRPILTGLNLKVATSDNNLAIEATSTDSRRVIWLSTDNMPEEYNEVTIPAESLKLIKSLPNEEDKMIGCAMYANKLVLSYDNRLLIILRLLEGNFPNVKALIPTEFQHQIKLETGKLREALTLLKLVNQGSAAENATAIKNPVTFNFVGNTVTLSSIGKGGIGSFEEEMELFAEMSEPFKITFTADYVMDMLKHIKTEHLSLNVNGALKPATMTEVTNEGDSLFKEIHLILPVRTH